MYVCSMHGVVGSFHITSLQLIPIIQVQYGLCISILQEREVYLPVAQSGSVLFFLISDLCKLNSMYQFGLPSFLRLFQQALTFEEVSRSTPTILDHSPYIFL